ncbi:hypothetical protein Calab_0574 [Caldithrix abyssi DSM 13497]|nr:hypothetical protein Calab_0574 [Caldithrix abyssi DSM 13497]
MAPKDYAIVGFYNSFNPLISPLISFYAFSYYTKKYFEMDYKDRKILKGTIVQSLIYLSFFMSVFVLGGLYVYMNFFNKKSVISFFPYALLSVFSIPLTGIITFKLTDYKMEKKSKEFFNLSVSKGVLAALLSILLVVIFKYGAMGRLSATFLAALFLFFYAIYSEWEVIKQKFDLSILKEMLFFVWPLILGAMLHFFTNGYDRVYLERLGNEEEFGFYVVAVQIVAMIGIFQTAINNTFQPDVYKAVVNRNWKTTAKYVSIQIFSILSIVLVFVLIAPTVVDILTAGRYVYSTKYVRVLAFSQFTMSMYFVTTEITIVLGYTKLALFNKILGVVVTVLLYSFLISNWNFMGAAFGNVISYFMMMIINIMFLTVWIKWKNKTKLNMV